MPDSESPETTPESGEGNRPPPIAPKDLKVKIKEQRLLVEWADGSRSNVTFGELRRRCPCATCRTDREKQDENPLRILKADPTETHNRVRETPDIARDLRFRLNQWFSPTQRPFVSQHVQEDEKVIKALRALGYF